MGEWRKENENRPGPAPAGEYAGSKPNGEWRNGNPGSGSGSMSQGKGNWEAYSGNGWDDYNNEYSYRKSNYNGTLKPRKAMCTKNDDMRLHILALNPDVFICQ
jgi:hypothetical protein